MSASSQATAWFRTEMHKADSPVMGPVALARKIVASTLTNTRRRAEAIDGSIVIVVVFWVWFVPRGRGETVTR